MSTRCYLCLLAALLATGCGDEPESPTSPTTVTAPTTILFSGALQPRGTRFYSYTLVSAGTVTAMLASLERDGRPVTHALEIGIGIPAGTGCAAQITSQGPPSLVPQLRQDAAVGTYCVRIADADGLPDPMTFTIRLVHP